MYRCIAAGIFYVLYSNAEVIETRKEIDILTRQDSVAHLHKDSVNPNSNCSPGNAGYQFA